MPKAVAGTGDLQVRTDPAGAKVSVDGQSRGVSPLTIQGLTPGNHMVVLENELGSVNEDVTIQPGATASLVVPMKTPQGALVSGWISIAAPAELQIFENERLLGSSRTDRIMVTAGRHEIEFSNDSARVSLDRRRFRSGPARSRKLRAGLATGHDRDQRDALGDGHARRTGPRRDAGRQHHGCRSARMRWSSATRSSVNSASRQRSRLRRLHA